MADDYLKKLESLRLALMNVLSHTNSLIMREKRNRNEDIPSEASQVDDSSLPLHPEVESPDQSKPTANRRASRRRRT
jgi:hypothetical protein